LITHQEAGLPSVIPRSVGIVFFVETLCANGSTDRKQKQQDYQAFYHCVSSLAMELVQGIRASHKDKGCLLSQAALQKENVAEKAPSINAVRQAGDHPAWRRNRVFRVG
jgi:hypothetical protein